MSNETASEGLESRIYYANIQTSLDRFNSLTISR